MMLRRTGAITSGRALIRPRRACCRALFAGHVPATAADRPAEGTSLAQALGCSREARVLLEAQPPFKVLHVNAAWEALTGFSGDTVCGHRTLASMQGEATSATAAAGLARRLETHSGQATAAVLTNIRADGTPFRSRLEVTPVVDEATGDVTHFLGVVCEIGFEGRERAGETK